MALDLVIRNETKERTPGRALFARVLSLALARAGVRRPAEIAIVFVSAARMRALNRQWRKKDAPTDVLSFPLESPSLKGYTGVFAGDLFICPAVARERAAEQGISLRTYLLWCAIHGTLHLAGLDHESSVRDERRMQRIEQDILAQ